VAFVMMIMVGGGEEAKSGKNENGPWRSTGRRECGGVERLLVRHPARPVEGVAR
jgi:hypothetical protein